MQDFTLDELKLLSLLLTQNIHELSKLEKTGKNEEIILFNVSLFGKCLFLIEKEEKKLERANKKATRNPEQSRYS